MTAVLEQPIQEGFERDSEKAEFLDLYRNAVHEVSHMSPVKIAGIRENYVIDDNKDKILTECKFLIKFLEAVPREKRADVVSGMGEILEAAYILASERTNRGTVVSRTSISYDI